MKQVYKPGRRGSQHHLSSHTIMMITAELTFLLNLVACALGGTSLGLHGGFLSGGIQHGGLHQGGVIYGGPVYHDPYHNAPAHYTFNYAVSDDYTGSNFGHSESRDGYKTEGKYYVNLPDGRIQTVKYYADETGYHPEVSYEGVAHYQHAVPAYGGYH
ncbi:pro-resilin-like [Cherax quadricarinatus]|uniref:pro-resilin-like n=1 Tax=Cherax quadricarinatus TaxID=27406 RepID=UPI00387E4C3C